MLPIRDLWTAPFLRLSFVFYDQNQKEFLVATVAIFRCDFYAAVFRQMSPPPPTKKLRTTSHDYAQLSKMVDFIVLAIKLIFMVLGVSYSRVLAQRPTGCCSASLYYNSVCLSQLANCRSQYLLDNLGKCLKLFVSTESSSSHEFTSQFSLAIFYTRKTPKTSGKPDRQRACLFE